MADSTNNPTDNTLLQPMYTQILGAPGTWISGGFITNEEYNPKLLWRSGIDMFDHMRRSDATIQALLKVAKHPILSATWDIEPASSEEFDQYVARFLRSELFDRNVVWYRFLRDVLGKLDFGFSVFEKSYELTEFEGQPRVGIAELGWRKQWSILRWETGQGDPGVTQQLLGELVDIPQEKLLVFVNDREGDNYQGISLLRYVYKDWDTKKYIENLMRVVAMRSAGVPVFEYFDAADKVQQDKIKDILSNFRANEKQYIMYPSQAGKLDWMKIDTNIQRDLIPMLEYLQHEIDKSILAQFLDLAGSRSGGSGGSRALSEDHSQLFEKALEAVANEIVDELNSNLIQQLCDLNWSEMPNGYPKLTYSNIGDTDMDAVSKSMNALAAVDLLTPDRDLENNIRERLDLPPLPDDIYDNYADRTTAQTQAYPLTQLGPGQNPANPLPTGEQIQNPPTDQLGHNKPGTKLPGDESNRVTRTNMKRDRANQPTPEANSYRLPRWTSSPSTTAAEELRDYRNSLIAAVMRDEGD